MQERSECETLRQTSQHGQPAIKFQSGQFDWSSRRIFVRTTRLLWVVTAKTVTFLLACPIPSHQPPK